MLFGASAKNSDKMTEIKGTKELEKRWPSKSGTLHVGIGARNDDYDANEQAPSSQNSTGNLKNLRTPPTCAEVNKKNNNSSSQTDHVKRQAIRSTIDSFYNDPRSPLHEGFTTFHKGIMTQNLFDLRSTNETLYLRLMTDVAHGVFPQEEDWPLYATGDSGWTLPKHVSAAQKCVMEKDRYPPNSKDEMPTADEGSKMDKDRRLRVGGSTSAATITPLHDAAQSVKAGTEAQSAYFAYKMQSGQQAQQLQIAQLQAQINATAAGPSNTAQSETKSQKYKRKFDAAVGVKEQLQKIGTSPKNPLMENANAKVWQYKAKYDKANEDSDSP
jgi:hypothetical protein